MALKGIKVLEFGGLAPAPFCGMILGDFGASITRIDSINGKNNFQFVDHGKKSLAVNLKQPEGVKIVQDLSRKSDVLIDPFRPGVLEKLGLGPELLCKQNPRLIFARLTGYGDSGFYSNRAGHDINYLSISGLLSMLGRKETKPTFPLNFAADFAGGGLICALGIVLALFERSKSGKGQVIDANMVEGTAYVASWIFRGLKSGIWENTRGENLLDGGAHFYDTYETKDGKHVAVGAIEPQFYAELLQGLGLDLDEVPYMGFERGKKVFTEKFLEKTQTEWCDIFDGKDACVTPVLSIEEASLHKHNAGRKSFARIDVDGDDCIVPKPAPKLSRTPGQTQADKEKEFKTGNNTMEILESLGFSSQEIIELQKRNVIMLSERKSKL